MLDHAPLIFGGIAGAALAIALSFIDHQDLRQPPRKVTVDDDDLDDLGDPPLWGDPENPDPRRDAETCPRCDGRGRPATHKEAVEMAGDGIFPPPECGRCNGLGYLLREEP